jgi:4-aminobutyrate aminotransferase/(S)-3-amino-2-methylpropionate transaminase
MVNEADEELLKLEQEYCSYGDTVHYADTPNIFSSAKEPYLYDNGGNRFFDLQMWYSAVNLGYGNPAINDALKDQIDTMPQLASQYLHAGKIKLAQRISEANQARFDAKGRVHFNVGGAQAVEDALKLVRMETGSNASPL